MSMGWRKLTSTCVFLNLKYINKLENEDLNYNYAALMKILRDTKQF